MNGVTRLDSNPPTSNFVAAEGAEGIGRGRLLGRRTAEGRRVGQALRLKLMRGAAWSMAFAWLVGSLSSGAVTFPLTWEWSNPWPHGNNIIDAAQTNHFWIQVAERGRVYTSEDEVTWTPQDSHTPRALRAVTFFKDQIVIVGESGTVVSGPSPSQLSFLDLGTADWLEGVAASPQLAVAVGDNGAVYTSMDGTHWQRQTTPFNDWLRSAAFGTPGGTGLFVAVGEAGVVVSSADGVRWETQPRLTTQHLNRVTWFSGEFWALGEGGVVFQSPSGKSWQAVTTGSSGTLNAFAGWDSLRLVAGDAEVRLRIGQQPWRNELDPLNLSPPPFWTYLSAAADTNLFLLCGRTGMMVHGIVGSDNSMAWVPLSDSLRNWLWDLKRFPEVYLAVGDRATLLSSVDGVAWDVELPPDSATNSIFLGIGGKTNLAVAVGSAGTIITSLDIPQSVISTNTDGTLTTNWVSTLGLSWDAILPRPTTNDLQGVTVFQGQFVVSGGAGTILTSPDARVWTPRKTPTTWFLSSLESFPNGLVAVGRNGTILTSPDAVSWTLRPTHTTNWIYRARYLGGQLIAVGQNGTILTSADGSVWTARNSGSTHWLNDVQWIDQTYFVFGNQGTILSSPDGVTWTDRGTITGKSLFAAAHDAGLLVTVGTEGVILRARVVPLDSPVELLRFPARPEDNVFLFAGRPGQRFTLERSTDLETWSAGAVLELDATGTLLHVDSATNSPLRQFFRTATRP